MCRNFTYEVVWQRRRLKAIKKVVAQKINVFLFFDIEFFRYFFRVLHEASRSWLKFVHAFQKHPVYIFDETIRIEQSLIVWDKMWPLCYGGVGDQDAISGCCIFHDK
jgi:hypothetical protein